VQEENVQLMQDFRSSMSRLASGVSIITCWMEGRPWGLTVSACCSVSVTPPLLLISLANSAASTRLISEQGGFGVNIMSENQMGIAQSTAAPGKPKFIDEWIDTTSTVSPCIKEALAFIDCRVHDTVTAGDHTIFIGKVERVVLGTQCTPLVYFDRQFQAIHSI
jgi:flavin reductase ActVB